MKQVFFRLTFVRVALIFFLISLIFSLMLKQESPSRVDQDFSVPKTHVLQEVPSPDCAWEDDCNPVPFGMDLAATDRM